MPIQRYEKEHILDACLVVFARHGYQGTSTAMLAQAASISKALIFHHFKSKKALYLAVLDRCYTKAKQDLQVDEMTAYGNFFEAKEKYSRKKLEYFIKHPDLYKIFDEAFRTTPADIKEEIEQKYTELMAENNRIWKALFEKVPLRAEVDREKAFELILATMDYLEKKYFPEIKDQHDLDEVYLNNLLLERNRFFEMIRYGIQK